MSHSPFVLPRFYPIIDTAAAASRGVATSELAQALLDAGAEILQFRHKGFFSRKIVEEMEAIAHACRERGIPFVVNDRADLAVAIGAILHLGQDDLPPHAARKVTGDAAIIGFSTHNEAQLRNAVREPVNYLALGPVFPTGSKENPDAVVGVAEWKRLRPLSPLPVVAIGGITCANAAEVLHAGADSLAIIGDLFPTSPTDGPQGLLRAVRERAEEWIALTQR